MAKTSSLLLPLFLLFILALFSTRAAAIGRMVGGRTKVKDVKTNKEVQDLGKYCVEEYNRKQQYTARSSRKLLMFSQVVEAEKQVVSGMKYYLKISATTYGGVPKVFDAVVVVKPWLDSKELLNFAPSPSTNIKQIW
ncbi:Cysteine proteinase inhibitor 2 [Forsythia ovata]|uniref:Cysteine proteinase inhibitor 2 n=1 Tax=Forsythia ovata TaxID=205694 RepID=A0ABD1UYL0_9LAMI